MHAIIVPGSGRLAADGSYRLTDRCRRALRAAERLAAQRPTSLAVFSGWSPVGGPSEAEQMAAAWRGPADVAVIAEPSASITAENMSRSLPLLIEHGISEVTLICGAMHLPRVRYFFGTVYPRYGIRCRYQMIRHLPTPAVLAWEAAALPLARTQRRRALAELASL